LQQAPKLAKIPLVYVVSRGNRDNRPVASAAQLADMGYKMALDALLYSADGRRCGPRVARRRGLLGCEAEICAMREARVILGEQKRRSRERDRRLERK